jgi:hypothetical protein
MSITNHYNIRRQKVFVTKKWSMGFILYNFFIPNASASLSDGGYLGTLNLKLSKTGCKFFARTCPVLQN